MGDSAEQMDLGFPVSGTFEGFAVKSDGGICTQGAQPSEQVLIDFFRVAGLQYTPDGGFTGEDIGVGVIIISASKLFELFPGAGFCEIGDSGIISGSAKYRADGYGQYGNQHMPFASFFSGVRHGQQYIDQVCDLGLCELHLHRLSSGKLIVGKWMLQPHPGVFG